MDYTCKVCGQKIEGNFHFWENHRQKIADYFHQYEPRETKDGKKVIFKKDIESYMSADFNDLKDRNTWLKASAPEERKEYLLDLLIKRKIKKNWIYAPGQTLLRLSNLPHIISYEREFGKTYSEICKELGFEIKYCNKIPKIDWTVPMNIKVDTREQLPLKFSEHIKTEIGILKFGDYSLLENENLVIERKSLNDFVSTVTAGNERFRREIGRAKKAKGYLIVLVESSFSNFRSLEYLPQMKHSKVTFDHASKMARDLYDDFSCFQIVFCDGRKEAARITEFVLKIGNKIKRLDLQYLIDSKLI